MSSIYSLKKVRHFYSGRCVLDIPDLDIEQGEIIGLLGANGSGKSTLLRILAFLERPTEGELYFKNRKIETFSVEDRRSVTLLLQESYLLKRTVWENVAFGLKIRGISGKELFKRVEQALLFVGLEPENFAKRKWFELSGGEAQRVALASRLILRPQVLLLDEPTASVDQNSVDLMKQSIKVWREKWGTTIFLVSHDDIWIKSLADQIMSLSEGKLSFSARDNLIKGIWEKKGDMAKLYLQDGQVITSSVFPEQGEDLYINPSAIVLSVKKVDGISARNSLYMLVDSLTYENGNNCVLVTLSVRGLTLVVRITPEAAQELNIVPGMYVWAFFKATSFHTSQY